MDMSQHRADKVAELRTDAQTHRDRGAALDALSAIIRAHELPVQRWATYWYAVALDAQRQARNARAYANELDTRANTVDAADRARAQWSAGPP